MDLPDLVQVAEAAAGQAIDADPAFASLAEATPPPGRARPLRVVPRAAPRSRRRPADPLLRPRLLRAADPPRRVPEEEQQGVVDGLVSVADMLQRAEAGRFDRALFAEATQRAADESPAPFLRGAFLGLLCEIRELPAEALAAEVAGLARRRTELMVTAGDLLDGMLAVSRTSILLGADALVAAVDDLLKAAEWDPFLVMLPRLRAAFERLSNSHRDSLAATVAKRYGLGSAAEVRTKIGNLARDRPGRPARCRRSPLHSRTGRFSRLRQHFLSRVAANRGGLHMPDPHTLARWRLVLGKIAEQHGISCGGDDEAERIERLVGFLFEPGAQSGGREDRPFVANAPPAANRRN